MIGTETLPDIYEELADPEHYLLNLLENMQQFLYRGIDPSVKIGAMGSAKYPNYLIARRTKAC